jgi:hypothetical protein
MLKPQDIVVLLKLVVLKDAPWTIVGLAESLRMSASEIHGALSRAENAGLYLAAKRKPNRAALQEFLNHGLRYVFAAEHVGTSRGMLTAHSAPGLESGLAAPEVPFVWPDPHGTSRGEGIRPLYRTVPQAALADEVLYKLLALVDLSRIGGARERRVAAALLDRVLKS